VKSTTKGGRTLFGPIGRHEREVKKKKGEKRQASLDKGEHTVGTRIKKGEGKRAIRSTAHHQGRKKKEGGKK